MTGPVLARLRDPAALALVLSVAGIGSTLLTWTSLPVLGLPIGVSGISTWQGKGIAALFLAVLLHATAAPGHRRTPVVLTVAGGAVLTLMGYYSSGSTAVMTLRHGFDAPVEQGVHAETEAGFYAPVAVAVALMVVAALQWRRGHPV